MTSALKRRCLNVLLPFDKCWKILHGSFTFDSIFSEIVLVFYRYRWRSVEKKAWPLFNWPPTIQITAISYIFSKTWYGQGKRTRCYVVSNRQLCLLAISISLQLWKQIKINSIDFLWVHLGLDCEWMNSSLTSPNAGHTETGILIVFIELVSVVFVSVKYQMLGRIGPSQRPEPDQTALDQCLHCLLFHLYFFRRFTALTNQTVHF